jgi:hypothetical protein
MTLPYSIAARNVSLSATVTDDGGAVSGGTVEFRADGVSLSTVAVVSGRASTTYKVAAGATGTTAIEARFSGPGTSAGAVGTGSITISSGTGLATFVKADTTTQGSWQGVYGADGYHLPLAGSSLPKYVNTSLSGAAPFTWLYTTNDLRALQIPSIFLMSRNASCWFSASSLLVDLTFADTTARQVAVYMVDWDKIGRTQVVDILDANNNILDSRTVSNFAGGQYLVWNISGRVSIRVRNTNAAANAVLAGIFFR